MKVTSSATLQEVRDSKPDYSACVTSYYVKIYVLTQPPCKSTDCAQPLAYVVDNVYKFLVSLTQPYSIPPDSAKLDCTCNCIFIVGPRSPDAHMLTCWETLLKECHLHVLA